MGQEFLLLWERNCLVHYYKQWTGKNRQLVKDEPIQVHYWLWRLPTISRGIYIWKIPQIDNQKLGRSKHVTGWTWKCSDLNRLCPKISPDTAHKSMESMWSLTTMSTSLFGPSFHSNAWMIGNDRVDAILWKWVVCTRKRCKVEGAETKVPTQN